MEGAAGRGARGRRGARSGASRGRGAARGAARASSRGRGVRGSPDRAVTRGAQQRDGAAARRGCPAQGAPAPRRPPACTAAGGGEVPPAPRSRAAAARAPAAQRRVAVPDGAVAAPAAARVLPPAAGPLRLREVVSRLTLPRQDVSDAADVVNQVVSQLIQAIRSADGSFSFIERLGAGSYYEHVKVGAGLRPARQRLSRRGGPTGGTRRSAGPGGQQQPEPGERLVPAALRCSRRLRTGVRWPFRRGKTLRVTTLITK